MGTHDETTEAGDGSVSNERSRQHQLLHRTHRVGERVLMTANASSPTPCCRRIWKLSMVR